MHASACCCCFRIGSRNDKVRVAWKRVYQTLIVFTVLFLSRSMRDRLGANRRSSACHSAHTLGPPGHEWPSTNDGVPREQSPHCNTFDYGANEAVSQARFAAMQAWTLASEAAPASPEAGKLPSHEKFVEREDFSSASEAEKPPTQPIFVSVQAIFLAVQPIFVSVQAIFVSVQAIFLTVQPILLSMQAIFLAGQAIFFRRRRFFFQPRAFTPPSQQKPKIMSRFVRTGAS